MKKVKLILTLLLTAGFSHSALAETYLCSGQAEYNKIIIRKLVLTEDRITIQYSTENKLHTQRYMTTEWMQKNSGSTDLNKQVFFIGATKSGASNDYDDISLPHFGQYKSGLGSEIAFNHNNNRVFGTVTCRKLL